jgi:transcriptional regulator with XRE-family HTH domain
MNSPPKAAAQSTPGERFRDARYRLRFTQADAADLAETGRSNISEFETGRKPVDLSTLHRWCVAIGIDPHEVDARLASTAK